MTRFLALAVLAATLVAPAIPARAAEVAATYRVTMTDVIGQGLLTDCGGGADRTAPAPGFVLAREEGYGGSVLHAQGSDLNLDLVNLGVPWTRKYDVGHGTSGVFNGCYGVTTSWPGDLYLIWQGSSLRFVWHFEYFGTPGVSPREYFTIEASRIPFPAHKPGADVEGWVRGTFPFMRTLNDETTKAAGQRTDFGSVSVQLYMRITRTR